MPEWIVERFEPAVFLLRREDIVRCRDCAFCRDFPQGSVCTVRGSAGWFATDPRGFCWLAKRREE